MASYYDEVEVRSSHSKMKEHRLITKQIEDMEFDEENLLFHSPCPCGDRFEISLVSSNLVIIIFLSLTVVNRLNFRKARISHGVQAVP